MGPCIYQIRNVVDGRIYVGSTTSFRHRRYNHVNSLRRGVHHCRPLQIAFDTNGEVSFVFEILEAVPNVELLTEREAYWMAATGCLRAGVGYNVALEPGASLRGRKFPGRILSAETRAKIGNAHRGRKVSDETRAKMSAAATGRKMSAEASKKRVATQKLNGTPWGMTGKRHTEASRSKISLAKKGTRYRPRNSAVS